jgi:peroxiredoxin
MKRIMSFRVVICLIISTKTYSQIPISATQGNTFNLEIQIIDGKKDQMVYLSYFNGEKWIHKDSAFSKNYEADFQGKIELPEVWRVRVEDSNESFPIFLENSSVKMKINMQSKEVNVSGSKSHESLKDFEALMLPYDNKLDSISTLYYTARDNKDEVTMEKMDALYMTEDSIRIVAIKGSVISQKETIMGLYILNKYLLYTLSVDEIMELHSAVSINFDQSIYYKIIQNYVSILQQTAIGSEALDFTQLTPEGNSVSLSDFRGKYVLIDFWASWCGPCRKENPNVVNVYNKYHNDGFEVLGVSLDQNKENWLKAIESDGLVWTQVSDLKGWSNEVANQYGIKSIPSSLLIDPNGIIIGKNLNGAELEFAIKEIFSSKNKSTTLNEK